MAERIDLSKPASAFMAATGLRLEEVGARRVTGRIDLGPEHHQPMGFVHGGVYAAVAETAASIGATVHVQEQRLVAVGVNNNTSVEQLSQADAGWDDGLGRKPAASGPSSEG